MLLYVVCASACAGITGSEYLGLIFTVTTVPSAAFFSLCIAVIVNVSLSSASIFISDKSFTLKGGRGSNIFGKFFGSSLYTDLTNCRKYWICEGN